ncbi:MAG TPA: hypothetical protein VJJ82_04995, partial [Candidatus Nanoarchaeia archaeon]|nr:hypothetical protein [Candidatus Nanoarchaeia archaeon]
MITMIKEVPNLVPVSGKEPGYEFNGKIWTKSSGLVYWHEGVAYCAARNGPLQTLDEAVEFRHDSGGADSSGKLQLTGTLLAVDHDNCAHVYEPSLAKLVVVASIPEVIQRMPYFDVREDGELGTAILNYSKSKERSFVVPSEHLVFSVSADAQNDSDYSRNETVRKLMPRNAKKNAANIARAGYSCGKIWFARRSTPAKGYLRVRAVGLGGGGGVSSVVAGVVGFYD